MIERDLKNSFGFAINQIIEDSNDRNWVYFTELNKFRQGQQVREYQFQIWKTGFFKDIDLSTGEQVFCEATLLFSSRKAYAWRFATSDHTYWLTSSGPTHGYEIQSLIDMDAMTITLVSGGDEDTALFFLRYINEHSVEKYEGYTCSLIAGHANFAHFIWNEMSGLLELEGESTKISEALIVFEPILPVSTLIRWPADIHVRRVSLLDLGRGDMLEHPGVMFSIGSTFVTFKTQNRVLDRCRSYVGTSPKRTPNVRRVWLSLRTLYRTAINEMEVFTKLIDLLEADGATWEVLIDGYSLPYDLKFPGRYDVEKQKIYNRNVAQKARQLQTNHTGRNVTLFNLTELDLPSSIVWAASADVYICHHGTQQHKIGWLTKTRGMIHVNLNILATQPEGWTARQAFGASLPRYLSAEYIGDCESGNERQNDPFFRDYCFLDTERVAKEMYNFIKYPPPDSQSQEQIN